MQNRQNYYIRIYLKRNFFLCLGIALPIALLFFIVAIFYDVLAYDMLLSLVPFLIGGLSFLCSALYILRFTRMIKLQEELFGIQFNDVNAKPLFKGSVTYTSENWFVHSGSCAFYRKYIKSLSHKKYIGVRGGSGYKVKIKTVDGKIYGLWLISSSDINKIYEWRKADQQN